MPPRKKRRKTEQQKKQREKGRRSYRKGEAFEKKAYPFLRTKGFKVTKSRVRSKSRAERAHLNRRFSLNHYAKEGRTSFLAVEEGRKEIEILCRALAHCREAKKQVSTCAQL